MDAQKVLSVLDIYTEKLSEISKHIGASVRPERADTKQKYHTSSEDLWKKLSHAWWCVEQCRIFVHDGRMEKAFRWLGFIQGVLFDHGIYSIEDLANHSRPVQEEPNTDPSRSAEEWSDEQFLGYVSAHCTTERALFSMTHVRRLLKMADAENEYSLKGISDDSFRTMHADIAKPLVKRARERLTAGAR